MARRVPITVRHSCCVTSNRPSRNGARDLDVVQRFVVVAAGFRRRAAHREAPGRQLDERHAGPRFDDGRRRRVDVLVGADVEPPEAPVGGDHVDAIAVRQRVLLAHLARHGDADCARRSWKVVVTTARIAGCCDLQLGLEHAAGHGVDPQRGRAPADRAGFAANHRRRRDFLVGRRPRRPGPVSRSCFAEREAEALLIRSLQHAERQHRIAERAAHAPEVVARAFLADAFGPRHRVVHRRRRAFRNSFARRASRSRTATPSTSMTSRNGTSASVSGDLTSRKSERSSRWRARTRSDGRRLRARPRRGRRRLVKNWAGAWTASWV